MGIRVAINHKTVYRYDRAIQLGPQSVRLRPAPHCRTPVEAYSLKVTPKDHFCNWLQDPFGNHIARYVFERPTRSFEIEVDLIADLVVFNPFDFFLEPAAETFPFRYTSALEQDLEPCLARKKPGPLMTELLSTVDLSEQRTIDFLVGLNQRIASEIAYTVRLEPGLQTCEETLQKRLGACRDSGWLLVQVLRHLGLAARFASGYLVQLVSDEKPLDGPEGPKADFTDLHAWAEVYLPGAGWVGLDPTSGLFAGEGHLPVACTPDPTGASPIDGTLDPCEVEFSHEMSVARLEQPSRPTKPYSDKTWARIDALGEAVDEDLISGDVRLTMGGEPTFVSADDYESVQWNYDALGENKERLAYDLSLRLRNRFTRGGVLHESQGKWYPGEPLPRWAFALFWRKDGEAVWRDPELLAPRNGHAGRTAADAERFLTTLAEELGVNPGHVQPAYEDGFYHMWKEKTLPRNVDPHDPAWNDDAERQRLSKSLQRGFNAVVGYTLPLDIRHDREGKERWLSGDWKFRAGRLELIPGDSPLGLRLPLASIEYEPEEQRKVPTPRDPMASRDPLPPAQVVLQSFVGRNNNETKQAAKNASEFWTALCVEPRGGRLHVFLPPCRQLEHYIALIAAVEITASKLALPVVVEGYEPPRDHRLECLKVTPDPGVIEINVHPSTSWRSLVETTDALYTDARAVRLVADKYHLDGRQIGTGGGNHIILGGPTPADSPILRRPDLLRSMLAFWNNHPSLSYLFSGLFVGPTSQAPRLDESRADAIGELRIAFEQIERQDMPRPWIVDRVFRHLLTDLTGNTHRSEFCIDKLYSPDSSSGRLGLLELRGFEMPPHPRMNLAQQLLIRAIVATFWKHPYRQPLAQWGPALYDRWALPEFIRSDFADVCSELNTAGYPIDPEWFVPHFDFRFPQLGSMTRGGVSLTLRSAVEPWRVLGEEPAGGGVSRGVDSSMERLEVKARGITEGRHAVLCNGRRLPLHPTGPNGEYVAGVRFRAWQPPRCLHPTIGVHTPLVFDIMDEWADDHRGRSLGGCTYHVSHPGGRSYDTAPINANEAEARRMNRFIALGHTAGPVDAVAEPTQPQAPMTLDLRHSLR